jgi:hypothetical protein
MSELLSSLTPAKVAQLISDECAWLFDHLLIRHRGHRAGLWVATAEGGELELVRDRARGRWMSYPKPIRQTVGSGLISKVYQEGAAQSDLGWFRSKEASESVDKAAGQSTAYQISVPLALQGKVVGVFSMVQLLGEPVHPESAWGFSREAVEEMLGFSKLLAAVIERNALQRGAAGK